MSTSRSGSSGSACRPMTRGDRLRRTELEGLRKIRFLHVSSAFPRKGIDVLLEAYFSVFGGSDDVDPRSQDLPEPSQRGRPIC